MEMIENFLNYKINQGKSKNTIVAYRNDLADWNEFKQGRNGNYDINEINKFIEFLRNKQNSNSTINRKLSALSEYLKYLYKTEQIPKPPPDIDKIKISQRLPRPISDNDIDRIFSSIKEKLFFELILETGCRISEVVNIKTDDIDFDNCRIRIIGKGDKERYVMITKGMANKLQEHIKNNCINHNILFPYSIRYYSKIFADRVKELNIRCTIHSLRHTFATRMLKKGMRLEYVSRLLGHSNINTTMIYTKIDYDDIQNKYNEIQTHKT